MRLGARPRRIAHLRCLFSVSLSRKALPQSKTGTGPPTNTCRLRFGLRRCSAAFHFVCGSDGAGQFSPVGRDQCFLSGKSSHSAVSWFSTSRLKLWRYSSTLRARRGGSKTERIFSVTSVSWSERGSNETTPDIKPFEIERQAIRRAGI